MLGKQQVFARFKAERAPRPGRCRWDAIRKCDRRILGRSRMQSSRRTTFLGDACLFVDEASSHDHSCSGDYLLLLGTWRRDQRDVRKRTTPVAAGSVGEVRRRRNHRLATRRKKSRSFGRYECDTHEVDAHSRLAFATAGSKRSRSARPLCDFVEY
jgi:hypothetical protein